MGGPDRFSIGGPPGEKPSRKGFGSKLIRTGLAGSGQVDLRYEVSGLEAEFRSPISHLLGGMMTRAGPAPAARQAAGV